MSQCQGFLSDTLSTSIAKIRRDFAPWFDVADSFNNLGMRVLAELQANKTDNQQLISVVLYGRTLTSFQSAYLLTERGMLADARTIVRAAAESTIVLWAVLKDAAVCDLLLQGHFFHHRRIRKAWLDDPQAIAAISQHDIERIEAAIEDIDAQNPEIKGMKRDPVNIAALAQKAEVMVLYNVIYRTASGDAAHTSPDALNRHVTADAQGNILKLRFGPETGDLPSTLSDAMSVLAHALHAMYELFQLHQFANDFAQCVAAWKALGVPAVFELRE